MLPAVAAFQLFIIVSLIVARLISARHLLIGSWIWTIFTLAAVFASWLILIQLLTIWTAYRLLRPRAPELPESQRPLAPGLQLREETTISPARKTSFPSPVTAVHTTTGCTAVPARGGIGRALDDLGRSMSQNRTIQRATHELILAVESERMLVQSALEQARRRRELADQKHANQKFAEQYHRIHAELTALFEDSPGPAGLPADSIGAPDFAISIDDSDPVVVKRFGEKVSELRQHREAFLAQCLAELRRDPLLKKAFWQALLDHNQPRVADAFVTFASARTGQ